MPSSHGVVRNTHAAWSMPLRKCHCPDTRKPSPSRCASPAGISAAQASACGSPPQISTCACFREHGDDPGHLLDHRVDPRARGAAARELAGDRREHGEIELEPAEARRLQDAKQPGGAEVRDGLVGNPAILRGPGRPCGERRDQRAGALQPVDPRVGAHQNRAAGAHAVPPELPCQPPWTPRNFSNVGGSVGTRGDCGATPAKFVACSNQARCAGSPHCSRRSRLLASQRTGSISMSMTW